MRKKLLLLKGVMGILLILLLVPCVRAGLQDDIAAERENLENNFPVDRFKSVLPLYAEVRVDGTDEVVFVYVGKDSKIRFGGNGKDFLISGSYEDLKDFIYMGSASEVRDDIHKARVYSRSFRAKIAVGFVEIYYGFTIVESKKFSDYVAKGVAAPAAWIAKGIKKLF